MDIFRLLASGHRRWLNLNTELSRISHLYMRRDTVHVPNSLYAGRVMSRIETASSIFNRFSVVTSETWGQLRQVTHTHKRTSCLVQTSPNTTGKPAFITVALPDLWLKKKALPLVWHVNLGPSNLQITSLQVIVGNLKKCANRSKRRYF